MVVSSKKIKGSVDKSVTKVLQPSGWHRLHCYQWSKCLISLKHLKLVQSWTLSAKRTEFGEDSVLLVQTNDFKTHRGTFCLFDKKLLWRSMCNGARQRAKVSGRHRLPLRTVSTNQQEINNPGPFLPCLVYTRGFSEGFWNSFMEAPWNLVLQAVKQLSSFDSF